MSRFKTNCKQTVMGGVPRDQWVSLKGVHFYFIETGAHDTIIWPISGQILPSQTKAQLYDSSKDYLARLSCGVRCVVLTTRWTVLSPTLSPICLLQQSEDPDRLFVQMLLKCVASCVEDHPTAADRVRSLPDASSNQKPCCAQRKCAHALCGTVTANQEAS